MMRWLLAIFSFVLLLVTSVTLYLTRGTEPELMTEAMAHLEPAAGGQDQQAAIGGPFELTDQNGNKLTNKDLNGKLSLVFFGYTHCPDICPVTLATLTSVMNHLGNKADQVVPVFITVDPKRDTPARLKEYLRAFHPSIRGLTGDTAHIAEAAKAYKVYFSEDSMKEADASDTHEHHHHDDADAEEANYPVDHSAIVYLMGRSGEYLAHFSPEDSEKTILETITTRLQ